MLLRLGINLGLAVQCAESIIPHHPTWQGTGAWVSYAKWYVDLTPCSLNIWQIFWKWQSCGFLRRNSTLLCWFDFPGRLTAHQRTVKQENVPNATKWERNWGKNLTKIDFPGLRLDACLFHAPANPRLRPPLSPMWKDILPPMAVKRTHANPHGGETVRLSHLWKVFLWQVQP